MFRLSQLEIILPNMISTKKHMKDGKLNILMNKTQLVKLVNSKSIYKKSLSRELMLSQMKAWIQKVKEITLKRLLKSLSHLTINKWSNGLKKEEVISDKKNGKNVK